jgi:hypothetical protein
MIIKPKREKADYFLHGSVVTLIKLSADRSRVQYANGLVVNAPTIDLKEIPYAEPRP